ncbi:MAG: glucans biosynthesis glucosyltransferase MdoH [Pseudolabrys sp.]|nr:glucans biosynthesis glucosyltransferase MdoH [Pseudolabrys sp.]MDP2298651.1 glucans biosynthesis glucosyltransferase MdoH [Pseudolabrys sp.]
MDAVTNPKARPHSSAATAVNFLPAESPIAMPAQDLRRGAKAPPVAVKPAGLALRRAFVFLATTAMTVFGADQMYQVLAVTSLTTLEAVVLVLFVVLFAWVAFSFVSALIGFVLSLLGKDGALDIEADGPLPDLAARHALLVPTYNETPSRLFARLQATYESVVETGRLAQFDFFVLSDTTDPDIWIHEEAQFLAMRERTQCRQIFYRHRRENTARKAGNIGEWVERFGGHYESMVILDADSLMTGDIIVRITSAIERNAHVGLIQTLPIIVNARSLFGRLQQFAGRLYGPMLARGIAWWFGTESNYWGHNAAIRVKAFAAHASLPLLKGRKPFGGHILSHDFVEAALMRRAGWAIVMAPGLLGGYEETPPSMTEYAARDRRWCQGNMQHWKVLRARGLHWMSRLHFMTGIGSYLTAPLWLVFLVTGILISLQAHFIRPEYFSKGYSLFPQWPEEDPIRAAWVFGATMGILIAPKILAYIVLLFNGTERRGFGGAIAAFFSIVVEILVSALIAPVMMLFQSQAVAGVLLGSDAGWQVQRRDDGSLPFSELLRRYGRMTLIGVLLGAAAFAVSLSLFLWMTPVIVGLVLAMPLAAITARSDVGLALRGMRLLMVPEERDPPTILRRANELSESLPCDDAKIGDLFRGSDALRQAHLRALEPLAPRKRGDVNADLVLAKAKMAEAESLDETLALLTVKEKRALLSDRNGFEQLMEMKAA